MQKTAVRRVALTGTLSVGWVFAKTEEYGRPLSRANAHRRRPDVTTRPIVAPK